jgi:hypothetical protein
VGDGSRFAGLVLGTGLTLLAPDAAAAAVVWVAEVTDAAAQVKRAVGRQNAYHTETEVESWILRTSIYHYGSTCS